MSVIYGSEDLNFFRLTKCVHDYSTAALRKVFIQEWNKIYASSPWQNDTSSGSQLLAEEMPPHHSRLFDPAYCNDYRDVKNHLSNGNIETWDITTLVFALSYSHALGPIRGTVYGKRISNAIHQIRRVRNAMSAHVAKASISHATFKTSVMTLITAVQDLLSKSDPIVENLQQMLTEREFNTNELLNYKKWLKNERVHSRSLERVVKTLEEKIEERPGHKRKTPRDETRNLSSERHRRNDAKQLATTSIDQVPSKWKLKIFTRGRYIRLIDKSNSLSFNFCWEDLEKFLQGFSGNRDVEIFAQIQAACALNQRSRKEDSLKMLDGLKSSCGFNREYGFLAHARIRICMAFVLHDMGNDDEAMREADEAHKMLRDGECFEDFVEIHNVKANIILSRSKNSTEDRKLVLFHLNSSLDFCGKVSVDKSVTMVQVTMRKALVHLGYYQHGIAKEVSKSDVDVAETVLSRISSRQIERLSKRSKIYYNYCQALLAFRKGDYEKAKKLEQRARRKCELQSLHNEIQQLDMLRSLFCEQAEEITSEGANISEYRATRFSMKSAR